MEKMAEIRIKQQRIYLNSRQQQKIVEIVDNKIIQQKIVQQSYKIVEIAEIMKTVKIIGNSKKYNKIV